MSRLCIKSGNLGFSRMGFDRQLKHQVEAFWAGTIDEEQLTQSSTSISLRHWLLQQSHEIDIIPSNDFSFYDHILDHCILFQVIPKRYQDITKQYQNKYNSVNDKNNIPFDYQTYFAMARGASIQGDDGNKMDVQPLQMKKWFDTNYHYSVPEFELNQTFSLSSYIKPLNDFLNAKKNGIHTRPVIIGPLSILMLGKWHHDTNIDKEDSCQDHPSHDDDPISLLRLLPSLLPIYQELFQHLSNAGVTEIQLDEPMLITDDAHNEIVIQALKQTYQSLMKEKYGMKFTVATYFGTIAPAVLNEIMALPIDGLHVDMIRHGSLNIQYLDTIIQTIQNVRINTVVSSSPSVEVSSSFQLSLGVIDGRNIWISDLSSIYNILSTHVIQPLSEKNIELILTPSCSLLHVPYSKELEININTQIKTWLSFGVEKLCEIRTLVLLLSCCVPSVISSLLSSNHDAIASRATSPLIHRTDTQKTMSIVQQDETTRILYNRKSPFEHRYQKQQDKFKLTKLPTTTIGSFPQTAAVRSARARYLRGALTSAEYLSLIHEWTRECIQLQETLDLDVLVHGEFERTDMVEFFAQYLNGYTTTQHGWVQSYGSRCVKPPILYGDVSRISPMTVDLAVFAQSCTSRPVKGMLTGPVTCLQWSFVRTDIPRKLTCQQLAMAIRQEVEDLERAGIGMIQIDEPALREGLPLNIVDRVEYVRWSVDCFRLSSSGVEDTTQIHSHMCYSDFKDIINEIIQLDADVLTIEHSRASDASLLAGLHNYPNALGPGVYDIHTPLIPDPLQMIKRIQQFSQILPIHRIWINPDCGLKTRTQEQVKQALYNMVHATKQCRDIIKAE